MQGRGYDGQDSNLEEGRRELAEPARVEVVSLWR